MPQACLPLSPEMQKKEAYFQAADGPSPKGESVTRGPSQPSPGAGISTKKAFSLPSGIFKFSLLWLPDKFGAVVMTVSSRKAPSVLFLRSLSTW